MNVDAGVKQAHNEAERRCAKTEEGEGNVDLKIISVSELETNTDKYIEIAQTEDVFITESGKIVAKLTAYTDGQQRAGE